MSLKTLLSSTWGLRMCLSTYTRQATKLQTTQLKSIHKSQLSRFTTSSMKLTENSLESEGLIITDACVNQMKKVMKEGEFLRVTVEGGGCSGFTYKMGFDKKLNKDDKQFVKDGVTVVSDEISLDFIKGSTVDYTIELMRSSFVLSSNPQSKNACSCGVSFSID